MQAQVHRLCAQAAPLQPARAGRSRSDGVGALPAGVQNRPGDVGEAPIPVQEVHAHRGTG